MSLFFKSRSIFENQVGLYLKTNFEHLKKENKKEQDVLPRVSRLVKKKSECQRAMDR